MTNITARKGLAFGALIALGSTLLAGAPAHAAAGVTLAPSLGTSYNMPAGYGFTLTATASSEIPSDRFDEFKFKITNVDGKDAEAYTYNANWNYNGDYVNASGDAGSSVVVDGYSPGGNGVNNGKIWLESNDNDDTSHYTVTAWLDANDNDVVDSGELSATQTVNFLKAADITATTKLTSPIYENDTTLTATTKLTNINYEQFTDGDYNDATAYVQFLKMTNSLSVETASVDSSNSDFDASASVAPVEKGKTYSAQAWIYAGADLVKVGAPSAVNSVAHGVAYLTSSMVATANNTSNGQVATNSEFKVTITATDSDDAAVAGKTVLVDVYTDAYSLSADDGVSITVNGVKYTSNAAVPGNGTAAPLSLVTDSKGQITLTVSSTGLEHNDWIGFFATAEGNVYLDDDETFWVQMKDRSYTAWVENNHWEQFGGVAGGTVNGTVVVYDQFGGLLPNGYDARVQYNYESYSRTTAATDATNSFQPVVNGRANFKIVDNGSGTGVEIYYVEVLKRDTVNGGYTGSSVATVYFANTFQEAVDRTPASAGPADYMDALTVVDGAFRYTSWYGAESNKAPVETADFGSFDSRAVLGTEPSVNWDNSVHFGAWVASADTATHAPVGVNGQAVTISGAGLQFAVTPDGDFTIYATDSITTTTINGYFGVNVWSHKSGLNSFTITAGGVSQKVEFFVDYPAYTSGASVVLTAPSFSLPGKTVFASAYVADKFGNPVYDAPLALKVQSSANPAGWEWTSTWTDENGYLYQSYNSNVNDLGTLTWTATLNKDLNWDVVGDDDIVKTANTVVALGAPVPADAKVSVASAATSQSGRAVDVTVTVTTAAGVAIPGAIVNLSATGAGYLGVTSATTDAAGKVAVKLIGGDNEIGDATVTATAGAVSASAKTTFGVTDANINLAGKRVTVDWSFAAGKRVVIYRNGIQIRNFVAGSDASDSFSFNLKKGTRKIAVKIGGVTIDTQVYVIK